MKKILGMFLTIVLLLGLLNVGASAEEAKYQSVTFANSYATLTIDKARVSYSGKEGEYTIYGVPDGAEMTVTITGAQTGFNLYIGASFTRLSNNGDANTGGTLERTAEYVLTADSVLQMVNLADENGNALYEDNNWDGSADVIRQNGTYHFTLSAPGCVGWNMTPLCGTKITGGAMSQISDQPQSELLAYNIVKAEYAARGNQKMVQKLENYQTDTADTSWKQKSSTIPTPF